MIREDITVILASHAHMSCGCVCPCALLVACDQIDSDALLARRYTRSWVSAYLTASKSVIMMMILVITWSRDICPVRSQRCRLGACMEHAHKRELKWAQGKPLGTGRE